MRKYIFSLLCLLPPTDFLEAQSDSLTGEYYLDSLDVTRENTTSETELGGWKYGAYVSFGLGFQKNIRADMVRFKRNFFPEVERLAFGTKLGHLFWHNSWQSSESFSYDLLPLTLSYVIHAHQVTHEFEMVEESGERIERSFGRIRMSKTRKFLGYTQTVRYYSPFIYFDFQLNPWFYRHGHAQRVHGQYYDASLNVLFTHVSFDKKSYDYMFSLGATFSIGAFLTNFQKPFYYARIDVHFYSIAHPDPLIR